MQRTRVGLKSHLSAGESGGVTKVTRLQLVGTIVWNTRDKDNHVRFSGLAVQQGQGDTVPYVPAAHSIPSYCVGRKM